MYVLMDYRWINKDNCRIPAQVAALRIDGNGNCVDVFSSTFHLEPNDVENWDPIVFEGHSKDTFLAGKTASQAFRALSLWLEDDDVLCWMHQANRDNFVKDCPQEKAKKNSIILGVPLVIRITEGKETHSNILSSAEKNGLVANFISKVLHKGSCDLIPKDARLRTCNTIKQGVSERLKPCVCCRREFNLVRRDINLKILQNMEYPYVHAKDGNVIHRRECTRMLNAETICAVGKMEQSTESKYRPCKCCVPDFDEMRSDTELIQYDLSAYKFLKRTGFSFNIDGKILKISTPVGEWFVEPREEQYHLEHRNLSGLCSDSRHVQPVSFVNMDRICAYIERHDRTLQEKVKKHRKRISLAQPKSEEIGR